jgi:hypothetical protein
MRKRDFHKKQAIQHDSQSQWLLYKSELPNFHQYCPGTRFYFSDMSVSNVALRLQNIKASKATGIDNKR